MGINEYAKKILADAGCDEYTYGGEQSKHVLDDLKEAFPGGMEFPYVDVANAILEMSRPRPIYRAPYHVVWDTDNCTDAYDAGTFEWAKDSALETLAEWEAEQAHNYPANIREWTEKQIEDWDYMIYNCGVAVYKYDPDTDEYEEEWSPDTEDLEGVGWLLYEEMLEVENG